MSKESRLYELASELFLRKAKPPFLDDKNAKFYDDMAIDAISVAKIFLEKFEEENDKK